MTKRSLMSVLSVTMMISCTYGQSLLNARAIAPGAYGPSVNDTRGFDSNPAGLIGIRDWEFTTSTYNSKADNAFVFEGLTFGKRFLQDEAVAFQYSPGSLLQINVPSGLVSTSSGSGVSLGQQVSYSEYFSVGLAHRFSEALSIGLAGRLRKTDVSDTKYRLTPSVQVYTTDDISATVLADAGALWRPLSSLSVSAVARNLFHTTNSSLPDEFSQFRLPDDPVGELGAKYDLSSQLSVSAMGGTLAYGAFGYELRLPSWNLCFRNGVYANKKESPFIYAVCIGLGWKYEFLEIDASYLRFVNENAHAGSYPVLGFDASRVNSIDLNPYSQDRVTLSLKAVFGNVRETLASIRSVKPLEEVYPSSYESFAYKPIGNVRVRNISSSPIYAKASFFVEKYMDAPTESKAVYLNPGEEADIPVFAVLNDKVKSLQKPAIKEGNVYVSAAVGEDYDDRAQAKLLIHGRNDWDGSALSLRHFVTPDDPEVLRYTRDILLHERDSLDRVPQALEPFVKAKLLFNAFAGKLLYVSDPKQSADYVQYPSETLAMRTGDCDDMSVCFSSLLSSVGISTAFVDVVPPDNPGNSHIYMMFDTGLDPKYGANLSGNPKRYLVRRNPKGEETIWIPVETTVITKGFEKAWSAGAEEFFDDVEVNLGRVKGWVRLVDVN